MIKPLLFKLDPEKAHHLIIKLSELHQPKSYQHSSATTVKIKSLTAPSPIGLAAGLDKNAQALHMWASLGFGMMEAGTVTLKEQLGNPLPRIWRYPQVLSLRNAMGFPNVGGEQVALHLRNYQGDSLLGVNIGKNKDTTTADSIKELGALIQLLHQADYFTINVSSPNTPGLRALQEVEYLDELFSHLRSITNKPLFLKIAPDLSLKKIEELATLASDKHLEGIVATNTTIIESLGMGGVSGALLKEKAHTVQAALLAMNTDLTIIGVGGIANFGDVLNFWKLGGAVVQIYTALIYQGPGIVHNINQEILKFLQLSQLKDLGDFFTLPLPERKEVIKDYEKRTH